MPEPNTVVVDSLKLAFLCVAKCASTSVKRVVLDGLGEHSVRNDRDTLLGLRYRDSEVLWHYNQDYFRVAVVRDPWDRLASCYHDRILHDSLTTRAMRKYGVRPGMVFSEFVRCIAKIPDEAADPHFRSQAFTYLSYTGKLIPNWLVRFEHLAMDWQSLQKELRGRMGLKLGPLPHLKQGRSRPPIDKIYDSASVYRVHERYKKDAAIGGYTAPF